MPTPRCQQVSLDDTTWYHCVSRCVRRSFLCGVDQVSGQDYSHRRKWVVDRILFLSQVFSIDVAAYAVMSNHHHVVLKVDVEKAQNWSVEEVVQQWHNRMPTPRCQQVSLDDTTWYHCVSRCVRRSFLCGVDQVSGQDYSHRRKWVVDRILFLSQVFSIDVAAYAVMSNHHHVVLKVDVEKAQNWSVEEVVQQWHKVYQGNFNSQRYLKEGSLPLAESLVLQRDAEIWRKRLMDISWFMKALNEPIARMANTEDNCTGRFYEGRFKSQALLDEQAILACMAYCDLNPIRAQLAATPETSDYTSIQARINDAKKGKIPSALAAFQGTERKEQTKGIPFALQDYIELVDITGRAIREGKRGHIDSNLPPILQRLKIDTETWLHIATTFEDSFGPWIGPTGKIQQACENTGRHWVHKTVGWQKLYPT